MKHELSLPPEFIQASRSCQGDTARLRRFLQKLLRGEAVSVATIGGSVTGARVAPELLRAPCCSVLRCAVCNWPCTLRLAEACSRGRRWLPLRCGPDAAKLCRTASRGLRVKERA